MKRRIKSLVTGVTAAAILLGGMGLYEAIQKAKLADADFEIATARVTWVSDGDTISVMLLGEQEQEAVIRLVGLDSPESVHTDAERNTEYGRMASAYTKEQLKKDQIVYLTKDVSDVDRYGRLLRFVWKEVPENPWIESEVREKCYNAELIVNGYALAERFEPDTTLTDFFFRLQEEAMENQAGLWAYPDWVKTR